MDVATPWGLHVYAGSPAQWRGGAGVGGWGPYTDMMCLTKAVTGAQERGGECMTKSSQTCTARSHRDLNAMQKNVNSNRYAYLLLFLILRIKTQIFIYLFNAHFAPKINASKLLLLNSKLLPT